MYLENVSFGDYNKSLLNINFNKETQTFKAKHRESATSTEKSQKLPLPREIGDSDKNSVKIFESCQVVQNPFNSNSITVLHEKIIEEKTAKRFRYCREVIRPYNTYRSGYPKSTVYNLLKKAVHPEKGYLSKLACFTFSNLKSDLKKQESYRSKLDTKTIDSCSLQSNRTENSSKFLAKKEFSYSAMVAPDSTINESVSKTRCKKPVHSANKCGNPLSSTKSKESNKSVEVKSDTNVKETKKTDSKSDVKTNSNSSPESNSEKQKICNKKRDPCELSFMRIISSKLCPSPESKSASTTKLTIEKCESNTKTPCKKPVKSGCSKHNIEIHNRYKCAKCAKIEAERLEREKDLKKESTITELYNMAMDKLCPPEPDNCPQVNLQIEQLKRDMLQAHEKAMAVIRIAAEDAMLQVARKTIEIVDDPQAIQRARCVAETLFNEVRKKTKEVVDYTCQDDTYTKVSNKTKDICNKTQQAVIDLTYEGKKFFGIDEESYEGNIEKSKLNYSDIFTERVEKQEKGDDKNFFDGITDTFKEVASTVESCLTSIQERLSNYSFGEESSQYDQPTSKSPMSKNVSYTTLKDPMPGNSLLSALTQRLFSLFGDREEKELKSNTSVQSLSTDLNLKDSDDDFAEK